MSRILCDWRSPDHDALHSCCDRWWCLEHYQLHYQLDHKEPVVSDSSEKQDPIPMILFCPMCRMRHVDKGEFAEKPHHTHACQHCGMVWRPALVSTVGVGFLPGFKDRP